MRDQKDRAWQVKHLGLALLRYKDGFKIFLSQAVTGAGKTVLGVRIASELYKAGRINRIVVLCPSIEIAENWTAKLSETGLTATMEFTSAPDIIAIVATYAGGEKIPGQSRTLAILDEIHHAEREHAWGITATKLANESALTLVLTGTPWMTRGKIAILDQNGYYKQDGEGVIRIKADAEYSYAEDLRVQPDEDRATVPVECFFFASEAESKGKDEEGLEQVETLVLEEPT